MKKIIFLYTAILMASIFTSCEKNVEVDLDTAPTKLVIDASIDWEKGTDGSFQTIRLTTTTAYYEQMIPVVSGAQVTVTNNSNTVFEFIEDAGTGKYNCTNFAPVIGESYTLTIVSGGQTYTATEQMIGAPEIGNVEQGLGGFNGNSIEIKFYFPDNGATDNFYMTSVAANITPIIDFDVFNDEFSQGNDEFGYYINEDLATGNEVKLSVFGISEQYLNYMNILLPVAEGGGGPWSTTPVNVRGNIVNQTNRADFALGYFRLSEVDRLDYIVQ
jgi:hypothetical protein